MLTYLRLTHLRSLLYRGRPGPYISMDEVNDYYTTDNEDVRTFPVADWCIGFWYQIPANTGNAYKYILSTGSLASAGSINAFIGEPGAGDTPRRWRVRGYDATPTEWDLLSTTTIEDDGVDRLLVIQRNETESQFELWLCERGGTASPPRS